MFDRIIEAFTRPHYQVTSIDKAIMFLTGVACIVAVAIAGLAVSEAKEWRRRRRRASPRGGTFRKVAK